jgi:hypothetical protein
MSIFCLIGLQSAARGQSVAIAEVSGMVSDPSGARLAGAQVTMIETSKNAIRSTVSDSVGRYTLPNLPVGPYRLEVKAAGFKDYAQTGIVLEVNNNPQINVVMQIGAASERIEVTAATAWSRRRKIPSRTWLTHSA